MQQQCKTHNGTEARLCASQKTSRSRTTSTGRRGRRYSVCDKTIQFSIWRQWRSRRRRRRQQRYKYCQCAAKITAGVQCAAQFNGLLIVNITVNFYPCLSFVYMYTYLCACVSVSVQVLTVVIVSRLYMRESDSVCVCVYVCKCKCDKCPCKVYKIETEQ